MAKTVTRIPPNLKSSWRDAPEVDGAVGTEDVSVALPRPALGVVVEDGLMIKELCLEVVVVVDRRELYRINNHRKMC